jgi:Tfp pilus assembly protein PilN
MVVRSVNQVVNFYNAHWKDQASDILVASTGLKEEVLAAIRQNFNIKASELAPLASPALAPEWYVSLGGALRGLAPRRKDMEISLLAVGAREEFQREQVQSFLDFWRVLTPASLAVLLIALAGGWFFLNSFEKNLAPQALSAERQPPPPELAELQAEARRFNTDIDMLHSANQNQKAKGRIFATLVEIVSRRDISVERLVLANPSAPVILQGAAASEGDIIAFKNELVVTPGFTEVNLPLTDIRKRNDDYSFSVSFVALP